MTGTSPQNSEWELINEAVFDHCHEPLHLSVWRIQVPSGWLYKIGTNITFVPEFWDMPSKPKRPTEAEIDERNQWVAEILVKNGFTDKLLKLKG